MQVFSISTSVDFHIEADSAGEAQEKLNKTVWPADGIFLDITEIGRAFPNSYTLEEIAAEVVEIKE